MPFGRTVNYWNFVLIVASVQQKVSKSLSLPCLTVNIGNSGKVPERPRKRSQSFSCNSRQEYSWDPPSPVIQGIWRLQSISRILSPPVRLGAPLFSEVVPERASQSWSWNSQQYWVYLWNCSLGGALVQSWGTAMPPRDSHQHGWDGTSKAWFRHVARHTALEHSVHWGILAQWVLQEIVCALL